MYNLRGINKLYIMINMIAGHMELIETLTAHKRAYDGEMGWMVDVLISEIPLHIDHNIPQSISRSMPME